MKQKKDKKLNLIWMIPVMVICIFFISKAHEHSNKPKLENELLSTNKVDSITVYITKSENPDLVETYILEDNKYKYISSFSTDDTKEFVLKHSKKEINKYNKYK